MKILVTGGAGFIGSHFVKHYLPRHKGDRVVTLDKLTYAGNTANLGEALKDPRHKFVKGDIRDLALLKRLMPGVDAVVHFAAETHVDRSLLSADEFIQTNVQGTFTLIAAARAAGVKRVVHVSTDEVYGSIPRGKTPEDHPFDPSSPYAASKAASDHMAFSFWHTYRYPVIVTRCTNNYGPYQYPEKFLPLFITNALEDRPLPVYGKGLNVRNWIHVLDHCEAVERVLTSGKPGEAYNIAGEREWKNIDVANLILKHLGKPKALLHYVTDRPGHDLRYAPDARKIARELGWKVARPFARELPGMIEWYRGHEGWWKPLKAAKFKDYYKQQYARRLASSGK
jgi:dTDP-glucose 4,6-dehydratase